MEELHRPPTEHSARLDIQHDAFSNHDASSLGESFRILLDALSDIKAGSFGYGSARVRTLFSGL
jgi:hypothetical protein